MTDKQHLPPFTWSRSIPVADCSLYEMVRRTAASHPQLVAIDYMGAKITYRDFLAEADACAAAFLEWGLRRGDTVTLSLPNIPGTLALFYGLNKIGCRAAMTHPLSSPAELEHYLNLTGSRWAVTVDIFYKRFEEILPRTSVETLLITKVTDHLPWPKRVIFGLTRGRKIPPVPADKVLFYRDFIRKGRTADGTTTGADGDVVLFSGGTTALPKGVLLSSLNFNALAVSMQAVSRCEAGDSILAILPVFHGFGLGVCIHTALSFGVRVILSPEFSAKNYIRLLRRRRPSYIAGVPTLFQALLQNPAFRRVRFDKLKGAYSGGDSLPPDIKERFDERLFAQGANVELSEGYGLTECVTACVLTPEGSSRPGAIGVPIPNIAVKVVKVREAGSTAVACPAALPPGETGEICVSGPTVMAGYLDDPEATAEVFHRDGEGRLWLHTGDLGWMDGEGYVFFTSRIKRIIKVSGVAVYPIQVEQALEAHPLVLRASVIAVPDPYRMSAIKAFVVLKDPAFPQEKALQVLLAHCKARLLKWAVPRVIEFRSELPMTLVGKVDYKRLEEEERVKR
jgi:long-chain acyl-CoA synthetase